MESEKKEMMDMFYKYKDAFSLQDEICTCLNRHYRYISIFIRSYHIKEDKIMLDKEMKRLFYLGTLKEGFVTQDKRVVTYFRH